MAAILDDALFQGSHVYGIAGLQGSGKSTLSAQVAALARSRGLQAAVLSIDDVYLTRGERMQLARDVHPLLATRGPPGTHDVALACELVDAWRTGKACRLPRFDKLGDDRMPASQWPTVQGSGPGQALLILEGWFLKTPSQTDEALAAPVNALEREEDRDGRWRRHCNTALARDYPALWQRIDRLLLLHAPGFDVVPDWRWQQECALQAVDPVRPAMSRAQVEHFVQHFERVGRQAWRALPAIAEWTVALDAQRRPQS